MRLLKSLFYYIIIIFKYRFVKIKKKVIFKIIYVNIFLHIYSKNKISVITDISVLGFYGYIGNIGKYRWIF